jgi:pimeloyl-ACP methyl ester carboxylesterase
VPAENPGGGSPSSPVESAIPRTRAITNPAPSTAPERTNSQSTMRMAPMWRKARRRSVRLLAGLVIAAVVLSLTFNILTRPANLGPREAGVPGELVDVHGSLTHFESAGTGTLPIVMLHGTESWSFTWRATLQALGADTRFRAYAPDMRGFGFTERAPDTLYNLEGYAEHIEEFIDTLRLDDPILVGSSLGGEVALKIALNRPGRIRGLVLVDPYLGGTSRLRAGLTRLVVPPFDTTTVRARERWLLRSDLSLRYFDPGSVNLDEVVTNVRKALDQRGAENALIEMSRTPSTPISQEDLARLVLPTLIVWGQQDQIVPVAQAHPLSAAIPGSRLLIYARTGHLPQEEQRERFAADLREFAGGLVPR